MKVKRVLQLDSKGTYNFWVNFDRLDFVDSHVWIVLKREVVGDFLLDGYKLAVERKDKNKNGTTIFYKLEREVI